MRGSLWRECGVLGPRLEKYFKIRQDFIKGNTAVIRKVGFEITRGGLEKFPGAHEISFLIMDEKGRELDQPLIEIPVFSLCLFPERFQDFMGFEEFFLLK